MARTLLVVMLTLLGSGCLFGGGRSADEGAIPAARERVVVAVENQNFLDVRVYWVRTGGSERRLGVVNGNNAGQFEIGWDMGDLQLRFDFIGGGSLLTAPLRIAPGAIVEVRIDPQGRYFITRQ